MKFENSRQIFEEVKQYLLVPERPNVVMYWPSVFTNVMLIVGENITSEAGFPDEEYLYFLRPSEKQYCNKTKVFLLSVIFSLLFGLQNITRDNKDTFHQHKTLCYRKSKIATCFGCTRQPSWGRMFQKCELNSDIYIYIYRERESVLYNFLFTFLKQTTCWWQPCTAETCRHFRFPITKSCVLMDCILIVAN